MENKGFILNLGDAIRSWLESLSLTPGLTDALMVVVSFLAILVFVLLNVLLLVLLERKWGGFFQQRPGPNRNGPGGSLQTIADAVKLLAKEEIIPKNVDKPVFKAAGILVFVPALMGLAVIPWGKGMAAVDLNIGLFYFLSVSSVTTIAFLMAGWSSNNKYSLLGGMRAVAQMVSYEIPLVFSLLGVIMLTGSLNFADIIEAQTGMWFIVAQPVAFLIYFIAGIAELNRGPFDSPEGEQEIVSGPLTEYSGMRWALFFLAEYANLIAISGIATTLFLGGWHGPWVDVYPALSFVWFMLKVYCMIFLFMWVRWTLPRVRIDHLMSFGWKFLIPLSLLNILVTGVGIYLYQAMGW